MNEKDKAAFNRVISWLSFLERTHEDIVRIMRVVQENHNFFNVAPGDDVIKAAADKLEEIVAKD